jgi:hypothetical protein
LAGFVQSLRATWRIFLLRFALAFVVLALAWGALAPAYAHLLLILGHPFFPVIENEAGSTYRVEGATIWTTRSYVDPATPRPATFRLEVWRGYASYDVLLLTALIVAAPGWPLRQRIRLVGLGLLLSTAAEFAFLLSAIEFAQLRPVPGLRGSILLPAGFSQPRQILFTWVYYFFQTMGRGLFPLVIFLGMIGFTWKPVARNEV